MIGIKKHSEGYWRLVIREEEWEFKKRAEVEDTLREILDMKEKYGDIRKEGNNDKI